MAKNIKKEIADAAKELLLVDKVKKLTVKDIVEKCHITRQTFYYHFEDIPHLIEWILEQGIELLKSQFPDKKVNEENFRFFFLIALNIMPYIKRAMETNYAAELEALIDKQLQLMFRQMVEEHKLYKDLSDEEAEIVRRYNSMAIMGILRNWSAEDEKNKDMIIHTTYMLLCGKISPF